MTAGSGVGSARGKAAPPRVLCVDDDAAVLRALRRVLSGTYDVSIAVGGLAALEMVRDASEPFAVVITDLRMPELSGIGLLQCVRQQSPRTARVLLTGHADIASATAAVNAGEVFRFLTKPCAPDALLEAVGAACAHHDRVAPDPGAGHVDASQADDACATSVDCGPSPITSHTVIDAGADAVALPDLVIVLNAVLAAVHPAARDCADRIEWRVSGMLERLHLGIDARVRAAAALSQLGAVDLSRDTAERIYGSGPLSEADAAVARCIRARTSELLSVVPALALVRQIVWGGAQNGALRQPSVGEDGIASEAQAGALLVDAACMLDDAQRRGRDASQVAAELRRHQAGCDMAVLDAIQAEIGSLGEPGTRTLRLRDASPEMTLAADVFAPSGLLMARRGQRIGHILTHRRSLTWSDAMLEQFVEVVAPSAQPGVA